VQDEKALAFTLPTFYFSRMATPQPAQPVKLVIAALAAEKHHAEEAHAPLVTAFGEIDYASAVFPFAATAYYDAEMGTPLWRQLFAFAPLMPPENLPAIKLRTNALESEFTVAGKRRLNLDPGYLDTDKFVLASTKFHGYKIYLGQGIWADMTLHYEKGRFTALPWSFPDFRSGVYEAAFIRIREIYKRQLKALSLQPG